MCKQPILLRPETARQAAGLPLSCSFSPVPIFSIAGAGLGPPSPRRPASPSFPMEQADGFKRAVFLEKSRVKTSTLRCEGCDTRQVGWRTKWKWVALKIASVLNAAKRGNFLTAENSTSESQPDGKTNLSVRIAKSNGAAQSKTNQILVVSENASPAPILLGSYPCIPYP